MSFCRLRSLLLTHSWALDFMLLRQEQQRIPRGQGHEKRFRGRVVPDEAGQKCADIRCSSTRLGPRRKRELGNDMAARCREGGLKPTRADSECIALSRRSASRYVAPRRIYRSGVVIVWARILLFNFGLFIIGGILFIINNMRRLFGPLPSAQSLLRFGLSKRKPA